MPEIIDAWMQIPSRSFLLNPMFDSLRRWPTAWREIADNNPDISCDEVVRDFAEQGVSKVFASAWCGPGGEIISN
ncbi:amidohydrolase, partial [Pseudomonas syringae]